MPREFEPEDEGKRVVTEDGDEIGTIDSISQNRAHVKPMGGLSDSIRQRLGWTEEGEESYELMHSRVKEITAEEVTLEA